jgi:hypothetical protein
MAATVSSFQLFYQANLVLAVKELQISVQNL